MAHPALEATSRTIVGKEVKKLRREGLLPAVVYGPGTDGVQSITLNGRDFALLYARTGSATLLDLRVEGGRPRPVLVHQVQYDRTRRKLVHVDFFAPNMRVEMTIAVPLAFVGDAPGVTDDGGVLTELVTELQVRCLPDNIPAAIEVDLGALTEVGAQLTASDIVLPQGVTLATAEDELVAKIDQPALIEEPVDTGAEEDDQDASSIEVTDEPGSDNGKSATAE